MHPVPVGEGGARGRHGRVRTRSGAGAKLPEDARAGSPAARREGVSRTGRPQRVVSVGFCCSGLSQYDPQTEIGCRRCPVSQSSRWGAESGPGSRGEAEAWDVVLTKRWWLGRRASQRAARVFPWTAAPAGAGAAGDAANAVWGRPKRRGRAPRVPPGGTRAHRHVGHREGLSSR